MLIEAGADIDAISAADSGGVPSATALQHAAVFGMTDVVDVLVAAGARISSLEMAAAAGDVTGWPLARFTLQSRIRALVFAADHQRLEAIDQFVEAGTPVNEADAEWGRLPLHTAAACNGCSPVAPTRTCATPVTTPPRWRNASKKTAPDTARPRPSSGPSHATAAHNRPSRPVPEPGHPNRLSRNDQPWVPLQGPSEIANSRASRCSAWPGGASSVGVAAIRCGAAGPFPSWGAGEAARLGYR